LPANATHRYKVLAATSNFLKGMKLMQQLPFSHEKMKDIVSEYPTPFYIYDERAIRDNIKVLKKAFSWNSAYREYFAVKTTPNPYILQIFKEEGCGVDCASETELLLAKACGFQDERIMFTSNATPANEYRLAKNLGAIINLDDTGHIDFLDRCAGLPGLFCFRFNPGLELRYDNELVINFRDSKFGSTKSQIIDGINRLRQMGINRFGIHSQFGAHHKEADYFGTHSRYLFDLAVDIFHTLGIKAEFINLAGGIGIPFRENKPACDITALSEQLRDSYHDTIIQAGLGPIPLFTELGLFMTGPYGYFVSSVLHIKSTYKKFASLDASTNSFMSPCRYNHFHHITVAGKENWECNQLYDVSGALCEGRDRFAIDRRLPELSAGDILIFHDAGAYSYSHGNNFNGKLRPAELLLCSDGSVKQIRRAETPKDYFTTLDYEGLKEFLGS